MEITSSWIFDCLPEDIYPHFFCAEMDERYPLAFRLGIPKPLRCAVLEGVPKVGHTRQCTTNRGYIRQNIVVLEENAKLVYQMTDSNVWCKAWVGFLQDTFILAPMPNQQTRVTRITAFSGALIPGLTTWVLRFSLKQAHRYAAENWRRLSSQTRQARAVLLG